MTYLARMDFATMIVWLLAIGAGVAVLVFIFSYAVSDKRTKRIRQVITRHRGDMSSVQMQELSKGAAVRSRRKGDRDLAHRIVAALNLREYMSSKEIRMSLANAGLRGNSALTYYIVSRLVGGAVGVVGTFIFIGLMEEFPYPETVKFLFYGIGGLAGFYFPKIMLQNKVQNRQEQMTESFPDALDLLLICVESGLGIEAAFSRVTEEIMEGHPVLAQEIGLTSAELTFLGDRRQAYENFHLRTGLPVAKALATTLIQSEQYGTPVGSALRVLAQEKRDERMSAAEKKAAALPAKLTVPMIIFFLPVIFIVVIGPAACSLNAG